MSFQCHYFVYAGHKIFVVLPFAFFPCRCQRCKRKDRRRCYHWPVGDENSIRLFQENLRVQIDAYINSCGKCFNEIRLHTQTVYDPTDLNSQTNPLNIDFIPTRNTPRETRISLQNFSTLLSSELQLRGLSRHGTLDDRRQRLRDF